MRSCTLVSFLGCFGLLVLFSTTPAGAQSNQTIYADSLQNGWADWGWGMRSLTNTSPVHTGTYSISANENAWEALSFFHPDFDTTPYTNLTFWINGGPFGGQVLQVYAELGQVQTADSYPIAALPSGNTWQQISIPLSALGVAYANNFDRFSIQLTADGTTNAYFVDDIVLVTNSGPPPPPPPPVTNAPVAVTVDVQLNRHPINPLIYGVAFASSNEVGDLNFTVNRSGGNSETRYNWQLNAHNLGADWYFESYPDASATPGASADNHVANSKNGGAQSMISIPMIGWMPKLGLSRGIIPSYSVARYGTQTSTDPYLPDAGNGKASPSGAAITNNDPNDANFPTNSAFQQGYVQHLIGRWGASTNGGVRYYIMDNEHSIWFGTHQDVHPVGPTMQEIRDKIFDYASMVKSNDPNALVCAPEEWGWSGYFFSGYDQQNAGQHDRAANGGWDYMPWLLNQIHQHDLGTGQRLLDYFTLHCYPQSGEFGNDISTSMQLLRNKSTRQLWDTNYVDQSWIGQQATNTILMLIPRMKSWVTAWYPGTKTGITEYNWGAEAYINGATAQADLLGIFGREGLDLATRWTTPTNASPTYKAMKLYRNYDGNKSAFGDTSVAVTVPNPDNLSAFAAIRTNDSALTIMVVNKTLTGLTPLTLNVTNFANSGAAQAWQLTASNIITRLADVPYAHGTISNQLPAQSITLFVLPTAKNLRMRVGTNAAPNQLELWMDGQGGQRYTLQSSIDLMTWSAVSTNTFSSNSFRILVTTTSPAGMFYRGVLNLP